MYDRYYENDSGSSDPDFDETHDDDEAVFAALDDEMVTAIMRAGTDFSALSRWNILAVRRLGRASPLLNRVARARTSVKKVA